MLRADQVEVAGSFRTPRHLRGAAEILPLATQAAVGCVCGRELCCLCVAVCVCSDLGRHCRQHLPDGGVAVTGHLFMAAVRDAQPNLWRR